MQNNSRVFYLPASEQLRLPCKASNWQALGYLPTSKPSLPTFNHSCPPCPLNLLTMCWMPPPLMRCHLPTNNWQVSQTRGLRCSIKQVSTEVPTGWARQTDTSWSRCPAHTLPCCPLDIPVYLAIMTHAEDRALRQTLYTAYVTRASELSEQKNKDGKPLDNGDIMSQILAWENKKLSCSDLQTLPNCRCQKDGR